jgi:hypothetical protein
MPVGTGPAGVQRCSLTTTEEWGRTILRDSTGPLMRLLRFMAIMGMDGTLRGAVAIVMILMIVVSLVSAR